MLQKINGFRTRQIQEITSGRLITPARPAPGLMGLDLLIALVGGLGIGLTSGDWLHSAFVFSFVFLGVVGVWRYLGYKLSVISSSH